MSVTHCKFAASAEKSRAIVNTGRKIPKTPIEKSPVLQAILIMPALQSGVLRP